MNRIEQFIQATERDEQVNIKSLLFIKNNKVMATYNKSPYRFNDLHLVFSIAKSFTSIGIGIARDQELLTLDEKLIDIFPDKLPEHVSENLSKVTLEHLLTMSSGITDDKVLYITQHTTDWVREFLKLDFEKAPGTHYYYSTLGSHMISEAFTRVTGRSLCDFLDEHLFKPLDIDHYEWGMSPTGATLGGMGLSLSVESIAKVGKMLLHKGMYNNKRILSEEYINDAMKPRINKHQKNNKIYSGNTYGYQFHIIKDGYFSMQGAFGQLCLIAPDKDLVLSITSVNSSPLENVLKYVYEYLLNDISMTDYSNDKGAYALPDFNTLYKEREKLKNRAYVLDKNNNRFDKVILHQEKEQLDFTIVTTAKEEFKVTFNFTKKVEGRGIFVKDSFCSEQQYISFAKWLNEKELLLTIYYLETSYIVNYKLSFNDDKVEIDFHVNVNLTKQNEVLKGRANA